MVDWYIGRAVAFYTLFVLLVFMALFGFTTFVGELDDVGQGSYGLWEAAKYVVLTLPRLAFQLFPSVALLGSMIGLGILANNSELLAMRAAGISVMRIVAAVMKAAFVLMLLAAFLGEVVGPRTEPIAQYLKVTALTDKATLQSEKGFWARDGGHFVHIRNVFEDGSLGDIWIYEIGDKLELTGITRAQRATYQGDTWVMEDITLNSVSEDGVVSKRAANQTWSSLLNPELVDVVAVSPDFLSLPGLLKYIDYLQKAGLEAERYRQGFWNKIASPLATGVMVFLAVPFIFGSLRSVAIGQRVLVGALVGVAFYLVNQFSGYFGLIYHVDPRITVITPVVLFFFVALILMRRVR